MATVTIKSSGSGTGNFTLEPPTTNTDRNLVLPDEAGTLATVENLPAGYTDSDALDLFNATGSAPVYACRAWVNFDGTGTVSIRESGNVSSITDRGTGDYTVNFTTAMPDEQYAATGNAANSRGSPTERNRFVCITTTGSTSSAYLNSFDSSGSANDCQDTSGIFFR